MQCEALEGGRGPVTHGVSMVSEAVMMWQSVIRAAGDMRRQIQSEKGVIWPWVRVRHLRV